MCFFCFSNLFILPSKGVQISQGGSNYISPIGLCSKAQKKKAFGKFLNLLKAFISSVFYIFSWSELYQNAVLHIYVNAVFDTIRFCLESFDFALKGEDSNWKRL